VNLKESEEKNMTEENKEINAAEKKQACGCGCGSECSKRKYLPHNWFKPCLLRAVFISLFYLIIVVAVVFLVVLFRMAASFGAVWTWGVWFSVLQILLSALVGMTLCMTFATILKMLKKIKIAVKENK
jgi:hypothetical protein